MNTKHTAVVTRKSSALTLVEALVVISIIAQFVAILMPTRCGVSISVIDMSNLRQIAVALLSYSADHDGWLPAHPRDATQYLGDPSRIKDVYLNPYQEDDAPIDRGDFEGPATRFGGYVFLNLGLGLDGVEKPSELILAYTAKVTSKQTTRSVQFADGHVEQWEEERLRAALPDGVDVDALDGP